MISIQNLSKHFGSQVLFDGISLQMTPGERLGLVGRNGHGKSTLFRMILGEESPDEGAITLPRGYRIGHLAQHLHFTQPTVVEEGCLGLPPGEEHDQYKVEAILFGLGFSYEDLYKTPQSFSGGFQVRLNLAKVLVSHPNLLLLDEPTNYLDIVSIRWITKFLRQWPGEIILISHDREFMDSVSTHTAAIHRGKLRKVPGPTAKLYEQIAQEEEIHEKTRVNEEKRRKEIQAFVDRFRAQATKAAAVQSRIKMLDKMPSKARLAHIEELDFKFHYAPFEAKTVMEIKDLTFGYDPASPLFQNVHLNVQAGDCVAIIGKNGRGKSTFLNVLSGDLKAQKGDIRTHPNVRLGYFGQTNIDRLDPKNTVEDEIDRANPTLGRTAVRSLCGLMMFSGDLAEKKVKVLSGGEKSRVMLGKILAQPANLLFLDEPTNHLDMPSIEALLDAIETFEGAVIIVTHSEMILREIATKLIIFQGGTATVFDGNYEDFLERVGWEDEGGPKKDKKKKEEKIEKPSASVSKEGANKKDLRKQRADVIAEKSKTLTPLKKQIDHLESEIGRLEKEVAEANQKLEAASREGKVDDIFKVSYHVKECQEEIETLFGRLEPLQRDYDQHNRKYEELLSQMAD